MSLDLDFFFFFFVLMLYWSVLGIAAEVSGMIPRARPSLLYTDNTGFQQRTCSYDLAAWHKKDGQPETLQKVVLWHLKAGFSGGCDKIVLPKLF